MCTVLLPPGVDPIAVNKYINILCLFTLVQQIPKDSFPQKDFKCSYTHVRFNDKVWVFVVNRRGNLRLWERDTSCSSLGFAILVTKYFLFFFHSCTVHLDVIKVFYLPIDAQYSCFKIILKFTLKQLLHVSVRSPPLGSVLLELAKVIVIKIIS
jgi:hypothetical protein